jgi:tetrathionate reductase subunit B
MARYAMVTDLRKCVGCQACTVACCEEWDVPAGQARTNVRTTPLSGTFPDLKCTPVVEQCNQCDRPSCVEACPSGATFRDVDGVVRVDHGVCIGCGYCVEACPYDNRFINTATRKVDKCDFCGPRVARGEPPACVATCTAHAKYFGDLEDRGSDVHRLVFREGARRQETASVAIGPNVYYLGKPELVALAFSSYPPHPPRLLTAGQALNKLVRPLVIGMVAATFLGQAVAFFAQIHKGEEDSHE